MSDDKWSKLDAPPPPMFLGEKEKDLVKQVNDEIIERVTGQQLLYFPIDIDHTNFHPLYGEAIEKTFLPPIRVFGRVEYQGVETNFLENMTLDKKTGLKVMFHKRRLTNEPKHLFGQADVQFEITAECIRARDGVFNAE